MTKKDRDELPVKSDCENAQNLLPSYLDGELSEAQAAPLREHLFACRGCREVAKEGRTLHRWFELAAAGAPAVEIPQGFAARVARRAFAGDPGWGAGPLPAAAPPRSGREILPFVLALTAAAAGLLLLFSVWIQRRALPAVGPLEADDYRPPWEEVVPEAPPGLLPLDRVDRGALDEDRSADEPAPPKDSEGADSQR